MDIAAAGFAAAQIASGQRAQQVASASIKSEQQQSQSVANLLNQAVSAAKQISGAAPSAPQSAPQSAPAAGGDQAGSLGGGGQPSGSGQRGSLINILA